MEKLKKSVFFSLCPFLFPETKKKRLTAGQGLQAISTRAENIYPP